MIDSDGRGTCGEGQRIGDVENDLPEDYEDWAKGALTTLPQTGRLKTSTGANVSIDRRALTFRVNANV